MRNKSNSKFSIFVRKPDLETVKYMSMANANSCGFGVYSSSFFSFFFLRQNSTCAQVCFILKIAKACDRGDGPRKASFPSVLVLLQPHVEHYFRANTHLQFYLKLDIAVTDSVLSDRIGGGVEFQVFFFISKGRPKDAYQVIIQRNHNWCQ